MPPATEQPAARAGERPRILLDCDPGHDDVVALAVAARVADLVGVTTVAGNAALEHTTHNACVVRDLLDLAVPVHAGASRPIVAEPKFAGYVHGESGLDGADLPAPDRGPDGTDAVAFIVATCRAEPGLRLVATGPLTNVALALRIAPDLVDRIAGIALMGGGTFGNRTPAAEFNIWADPEAADVVFGSGVPITMVGLDVTHQFLVTDDRIAQVAAGDHPFARTMADLFRFFTDNYRSRHHHIEGAALHDPLAVLAVSHPHLFTGTDRHVAIETTGGRTRGMTVIDRRDMLDQAPPNAHVLDTVDAAAAWSIVLPAITEPSARYRP